MCKCKSGAVPVAEPPTKVPLSIQHSGQDSLSYGMVYRNISTHIQMLGGSHITVGVLMVGILIGEILSSRITKCIHEKRNGLICILITIIICHVMMIMTSSYWFTMLTRILFSAINQSQNICLDLLVELEPNGYTKERLLTNFSILSASGFIVGPIVGGYLFGSPKGFRLIGMLAAFLTFINVILVAGVESSCDYSEQGKTSEDPESYEVLVRASATIEHLKKCKLGENWDLILLKFLFASSALIFFSKFPLVLKHNYDFITSITLGYSIAYLNALMFTSTYYATTAKSVLDQYPLTFISELALFLLFLLILLACFAPSYEIFMLLLIPIVFLNAMMTKVWQELVFERERKSDSLLKLDNIPEITAKLTIPLLFGVICEQIAHHAVVLCTCAPLILCWIIIRSYSKFLKIKPPLIEPYRFGHAEKIKFC